MLVPTTIEKSSGLEMLHNVLVETSLVLVQGILRNDGGTVGSAATLRRQLKIDLILALFLLTAIADVQRRGVVNGLPTNCSLRRSKDT